MALNKEKHLASIKTNWEDGLETIKNAQKRLEVYKSIPFKLRFQMAFEEITPMVNDTKAYNFSYAKLENIQMMLRPILSRYGIFLGETTFKIITNNSCARIPNEQNVDNDWFSLVERGYSQGTGEKGPDGKEIKTVAYKPMPLVRFRFTLNICDSISDERLTFSNEMYKFIDITDLKSEMQACGGVKTYLTRYTLKDAFNIPTSDKDLDGILEREIEEAETGSARDTWIKKYQDAIDSNNEVIRKFIEEKSFGANTVDKILVKANTWTMAQWEKRFEELALVEEELLNVSGKKSVSETKTGK